MAFGNLGGMHVENFGKDVVVVANEDEHSKSSTKPEESPTDSLILRKDGVVSPLPSSTNGGKATAAKKKIKKVNSKQTFYGQTKLFCAEQTKLLVREKKLSP